MTERRIKFWNIHLNKFFESILLTMPSEMLRFFTPLERMNMVKKRAALIRNTSLEEKLHYLAKAGVRYAIVMVDAHKYTDSTDLLRLLRIFNSKAGFELKDAKNELKEGGVFFLTDADIVRSMTLMAATYEDEKMFSLLKEYSQLNNKLFKLNKKVYDDMQAELSASHDLNKLILNVWSASRKPTEMEKKLGISFREFSVLVLLSKKRIAIMRDIQAVLDVEKAAPVVASLIEKKAVEKVFVSDEVNTENPTGVNKYLITGYGQVLMTETQKFLLRGIYD